MYSPQVSVGSEGRRLSPSRAKRVSLPAGSRRGLALAALAPAVADGSPPRTAAAVVARGEGHLRSGDSGFPVFREKWFPQGDAQPK
jgi:hypothetical protein